MIYKEEIRDLFSVPDDYYLAHCISADFALGAGIAVEFVKRFDMRQKLNLIYPYYEINWKSNGLIGDCKLVDRVFNLITKEHYWNKPTYISMLIALESMYSICINKGIRKIAIPIIGCGLDKLEWGKVSELIKKTFSNLDDMEILVCKQK